MVMGYHLGLTIHFEKAMPDALETWLSNEARYVFGAFCKPRDLGKIFGPNAVLIIAECLELSEKVVSSISMVLSINLQKIDMILVRLQNGTNFLLDGKYQLIKNPESNNLMEAFLREDGPRVFSVVNV
jgi:hypothetical protein